MTSSSASVQQVKQVEEGLDLPTITRSDIAPSLEYRRKWVEKVLRFTRMKIYLTARWAFVSEGRLDTNRVQLPSVSLSVEAFSQVNDALPSTMGALYHAAKAAKPYFDSLVTQVAEKAKLEAVFYEEWTEWIEVDDEDAARPAVLLVPIKDRDRTMSKAKEFYDGNTTAVRDIVRASIVCNTEVQIVSVLAAVEAASAAYERQKRRDEEEGEEEEKEAKPSWEEEEGEKARVRVLGVKNRFMIATNEGYRDILISLVVDYVDEDEEEGEEEEEEGEEAGEKKKKKIFLPFVCEIQIHLAPFLRYSRLLDAMSFYTYFRGFFGPSTQAREITSNRLKALKTMDQVGEFVEQLEGSMLAYMSGIGKVGKNLPRLSAYFELFIRVGETNLAEGIQRSVITQLRAQSRLNELFRCLSALSSYFKSLKRYEDAQPLSQEALEICEQIYGAEHLVTAVQLSSHAGLLYCRKLLDQSLPLLLRALEIRKTVLGEEHNDTLLNKTRVAELYEDLENWEQARELHEHILLVRLRLSTSVAGGIAGPDVAEVMLSLATNSEVQGDLKEALKMTEGAHDVFEKFYGENHLSNASCLAIMAELLDKQGWQAKALSLHQRALAMRKYLYIENAKYVGLSTNDAANPFWPCIADSLNSIGEIVFEQGNFDEAISYFEQCVETRTLLNTSQHHKQAGGADTAALALATAQTNLGEALMHKGQDHYPRCKDLLNAAFSSRMKHLGTNALATRHTLNVQAVLYELIQSYKMELMSLNAQPTSPNKGAAAAAAATAATLEGESLKKADSSSVSLASNALSSSSSNLLVAVDSSQQQQIARGNSSSNSPSRTKSQSGAAASEVLLERQNSQSLEPLARTGSQTAAESIERTNSSSSATAVNPLVSTASSKAATAATAAAVDPPKHIHTQGVFDMSAGEQLDETVAAAHTLLSDAIELRDVGDYAEAKLKCQEALKLLEPQRAGGAFRRMAWAVVWSCLGCVEEDRKDFVRAEDCYRKCLEALYQVYGATIVHCDVALMLRNIGGALRAQRQYSEGLGFLQQSKAMWQKLLGRDEGDEMHVEIASLYHGIAQCLHGLKRLPEAYDAIQKACELRNALFGTLHPDSSSSLNTLGLIQADLGHAEMAYETFEEFLYIRRQTHGTSDPSFALAVNNLSCQYFRFDDLTRSGRLFTESQELRERQVGIGSPDVQTSLKNMAALFVRQEDLTNAAAFVKGEQIVSKFLAGEAPPPFVKEVKKSSRAAIIVTSKSGGRQAFSRK